MNQTYLDTARLLTQVAPLVFVDDTFANDAIQQAAERLNNRGFQTHVPAADAGETKLLVRRGRIEVKIEANFVMRGTVRPVGQATARSTRCCFRRYATSSTTTNTTFRA